MCINETQTTINLIKAMLTKCIQHNVICFVQLFIQQFYIRFKLFNINTFKLIEYCFIALVKLNRDREKVKPLCISVQTLRSEDSEQINVQKIKFL